LIAISTNFTGALNLAIGVPVRSLNLCVHPLHLYFWSLLLSFRFTFPFFTTFSLSHFGHFICYIPLYLSIIPISLLPVSAFDRFLTQLDRYRNGKRFAIAIDEFELIETQIDEGILEPRLLSYFLGILQTYPWLFFAFAGLHTLEEMTRNYWEPLFAKVTRISVSFLEAPAARQLITQPTPDFNLDYAEDAIELIIQLTAGQPYLIQLICLSLVSRFNDQNFISVSPHSVAKDRDKNFKFKVEDVEIVIQNNEFESNGSAYFRGIWDRGDVNQQLILKQLASEDLSLPDLLTKIQLTPEQIQLSLENLKAHDVLAEQQDKYTYCVPLMRRWVAKYKLIDLSHNG
jgi:hypothetical protein